jgi:peptidoglycan hydrolase-like protein with peptidoglycan-binding domain
MPPSPALVPVAAPAAPFVAVGGGDGEETARVQQRLLELGFWLSAVDGDYGLTTSQAVMAFQKYVGLETSARVDQATADALTAATMRAHGAADAGTLVEVDKDRQLLFFVQEGRTVWVFNTSTGNGQEYTEEDQNSPGDVINGVSMTPNGLHEVDRERPEGWWEGDLGKIYRPKYFVGGVAVHGSNSVPNHPASHGCVRVTTVAMDFIWDANLMPMGIPVWVRGAN